jgi:hypothetical protein
MGNQIKDVELQPVPRVVNASKGDTVFITMKISHYHAGNGVVAVDNSEVGHGMNTMIPLGPAFNLIDTTVYTVATLVDYSPYNDTAVLETYFYNENGVPLFKSIDSHKYPDGPTT